MSCDRKFGPRSFIAGLLLLLSLQPVAGCSSATVTSLPPGATIFIDGKDSGLKTPAKISPGDLKSGSHKITVRAEGYQTPNSKLVHRKFGVGRLITAILMPVPFLIINLIRGFYSVEPGDIEFNLDPGPATVAYVPTAPTTQPTAPVAAPSAGSSFGPLTVLNIPEGWFGKMAVVPTQFDETSRGQVPSLFDDYLLSSVQNIAQAEVIGQDDISALLGFEAQKDMLDCSDTSCIADIGGALGVDRIVVVKIARLEDQWVATAKIIDIKNTRVEARVNEMITGNVKALLQATPHLVHKLFKAALANPRRY